MATKTCIVIAGATASGKTATAIEIAKNFNTEIISADSRQCYRELNVGVARPSPEEIAAVKHHFIASHSIHEPFTVADFEKYALGVLDNIFQQNDVAVVVGGTGLFIKALCEGLDEIPAVPDDLREKIISQYNKNGLHWLSHEIQQQDSLFFAKGEMQNPQRMMRALEVKMHTGKSIIEWKTGNKKQRPFRIVRFHLQWPRELLYQRINDRVDDMVQKGLEAEAQSLYAFRNLNALQTVGYSEWFDFFDGKISREVAIDTIKKNTRNYAKRQVTWFKKETGMISIHPGQINEIITASHQR